MKKQICPRAPPGESKCKLQLAKHCRLVRQLLKMERGLSGFSTTRKTDLVKIRDNQRCMHPRYPRSNP